MNVPKTVEEISEQRVRDYLNKLIETGEVLGILLQGSRVTGFNPDPQADWDFFIWVTQEYFDTLELRNIHRMDMEEINGNKRLSGDYAFLPEQVFENQFQSPMDIDHIAYVNCVTLYDPTGKMEEWRQKLAAFPEDMYIPRLKAQATQLRVAAGYVHVNTVREFDLDARVNYFRTINIAIVYWFSLQKSWTPQLKWWSQHAKRLGMDDATFIIFEKAIEDINMKNLGALIRHLMDLTKEKGVTLDPMHDFLETLLPKGREPYIQHSYF